MCSGRKNLYWLSLMKRIHPRAVLLSIILVPSAATSQESEAVYFKQAIIAFKKICIDSMPNFRGAERATRNLGIRSFREDVVGVYTGFPRIYAYNFELPADEYGLNWATKPGQIAVEFGPSSTGSDNTCSVEYFEPVGGLTYSRANASFVATMESFLVADEIQQADSSSNYVNFWYGRFPGQVRFIWAGDIHSASGARVTFNLWLGDVN